MPPIIIDSDDENIDALSDHDHIDAEPGRREEIIERPQDDRTQSTGSTERMLRQAHHLMAGSVTPDRGRQSTNQSAPTRPDNNPSSARLKRPRVEPGTQGDSSANKRRRTDSHHDPWDVPPSSSPSKSRQPQVEAVVMITEPGSTIMDSTSSAERRVKELTGSSATGRDQEADDAQTSDACIVLNPSQQHVLSDQQQGGQPSPSGSNIERTRKKSVSKGNAHNDDMDELSIGLPKERYQPRPSRSRSHQVSSSTSAHAPEQMGSQPLRVTRRKTVDIVRDEDREALVDMGFNSSQAVKALREASGNIQHATDWLLSGADHGDKENAFTTSENGQFSRKDDQGARGRPRKAPVMLEDEEEQVAADAERDIRDADEKFDAAREVQDNDRKDRRETDAERSKLKSGGKDSKKKRGRGRPRKQDDPAVDQPKSPGPPPKTVDDENHENHADTATTGVAQARGEKRDELGAEAINSCLSEDDGDARKALMGGSTDISQDTISFDKSFEQPSKEINSVGKVIASPSGTSGKRGRVPLRVGLSKKFRIPSLLSSARKPSYLPATEKVRAQSKSTGAQS